MIIHSIKASNVLKYENLVIDNLPEEGIIAISGFNESGKSTIGETICFALFGRTFSINDDELIKILRWGASDCEVTICFSKHNDADNNDQRYAITRMLDDDGNHSVKLYSIGQEESPLARGVHRVAETLYQLTAVKFEEFIESFYLAQREITTPHPHSNALKVMAGIASLEHCEQEIKNDIQQDFEPVIELEDSIEQLEEDVSALEIDEDYLITLTSEYEQISQDKTQTDEILNDYQRAIEEYCGSAPSLWRAQAKQARGGLWAGLSFIVAALSIGLWWLLTQVVDHAFRSKITDQLETLLPQLTETHYPYFLYLGIAAFALCLLFWLLIIKQQSNIKNLSQKGLTLAEQLQAFSVYQTSLDDAIIFDDAEADDETESDNTVNAKSGEASTDVAIFNQSRQSLINQVACNKARVNSLRSGTDADIDFLTQRQNQQIETLDELSTELEIEQERVDQATALTEQITSIDDQRTHKIAKNKARELACELLRRATKQLSKRFNRVVRNHVGKTLPLFTDNRYEHLQIDDDLTVRVFSNEKRGFMDLDEISSGTQRQIMLAVRLALSQELVHRNVQGQQFMILDEPFAFFDAERTAKSLAVLPELSKEISQIWIIAQSFPENMTFQRMIHCERDMETAIV